MSVPSLLLFSGTVPGTILESHVTGSYGNPGALPPGSSNVLVFQSYPLRIHTLKNLIVRVLFYQFPDGVDMKVRKNGVDTALQVSFNSGGTFSNFVDSVVYNDGDLLDLFVEGGPGYGSSNFMGMTATVECHDGNQVSLFSGTLLGADIGAVTLFLANPGMNFLNATPGGKNFPIMARTMRNLSVKPTTDMADNFLTDSTVTVYKNGAPTALTVTIPAGSSALVTNLADTVTFNDFDLLDVVVNNAAGSGSGKRLRVNVSLESST